MRIQFFLFRVQRVPCANSLGPLGQPGASRNNAQLLLTSQRFLANFIPALVKLSLEFVNPLLRSVMWCVSGAGCVVAEEGLVGAGLDELDGLPPPDLPVPGNVGANTSLSFISATS